MIDKFEPTFRYFKRPSPSPKRLFLFGPPKILLCHERSTQNILPNPKAKKTSNWSRLHQKWRSPSSNSTFLAHTVIPYGSQTMQPSAVDDSSSFLFFYGLIVFLFLLILFRLSVVLLCILLLCVLSSDAVFTLLDLLCPPWTPLPAPTKPWGLYFSTN